MNAEYYALESTQITILLALNRNIYFCWEMPLERQQTTASLKLEQILSRVANYIFF